MDIKDFTVLHISINSKYFFLKLCVSLPVTDKKIRFEIAFEQLPIDLFFSDCFIKYFTELFNYRYTFRQFDFFDLFIDISCLLRLLIGDYGQDIYIEEKIDFYNSTSVIDKKKSSFIPNTQDTLNYISSSAHNFTQKS